MVTVVTRVRVKEGSEDEWDRVFAERVDAAQGREGFVFVQLCRREGSPSERVIVGTWERREHWEAWHQDPEFVETRRELEHAAEDGTGDTDWYDVVVERRG